MTWDRRLYFPSEGRRAEDFFIQNIVVIFLLPEEVGRLDELQWQDSCSSDKIEIEE